MKPLRLACLAVGRARLAAASDRGGLRRPGCAGPAPARIHSARTSPFGGQVRGGPNKAAINIRLTKILNLLIMFMPKLAAAPRLLGAGGHRRFGAENHRRSRRCAHEAHISAQEEAKKRGARVPQENVDIERPESFAEKTEKRQGKAERLGSGPEARLFEARERGLWRLPPLARQGAGDESS
jgi:hypothetical protein